MSDQALTYQQAGVDIDEAQRSLRAVEAAIRNTQGERVIGGIGGFGGLFSGSFPECERPVLVSSIDGVGTKTKVAAMAGDFSGLGEDIVNHCANDILCQGAKPLFFLDYFGCSRLSAEVFEQVLGGAARACSSVGCALIGGETAEMPGIYVDDEIDLVGCIVGLVDHDKRLPRPKMRPGDLLIGLASNGLHTNGYSLARRALFEIGGLSIRDTMPDGSTTIGEALLKPHKCYFNGVYPSLEKCPDIYAVAHVTGGGLYDNLPRVMPSDVQAVIDTQSWSQPSIFSMIQQAGNIPQQEMYRAFNMGIGMVLFVDKHSATSVLNHLVESGETASIIGELRQGPHDVQIV